MSSLEVSELKVVLINGGEDLVELVLVILGHILKVILEGAGVVGHALNFELNLGVSGDGLLVDDHFLVDLVTQVPQLLTKTVSFSLGIFQSLLQLNA